MIRNFDNKYRADCYVIVRHAGSRMGPMGAWEKKFNEKTGFKTEYFRHMKIDEAKTPYHDPNNPVESVPLSESDLLARLEKDQTPAVMKDYDSDDDLTPVEKKAKNDFKSKRSEHYNMKEAMLRARKMIEDEDEE